MEFMRREVAPGPSRDGALGQEEEDDDDQGLAKLEIQLDQRESVESDSLCVSKRRALEEEEQSYRLVVLERPIASK
jgi:hypothetical protein